MSLKSVISISLLIGIFLLLSFSANPPQGRTGAPGELTCAVVGCHSGINPTINGHVTLRGLPTDLIPSRLYNLQLDLIVDQGAPIRGGFQMTALTNEENDVNGFSNPGSSTSISQANDRSYWEHDPSLFFEGSDTLSYTVDWQFNSVNQDDQIIFYAAANFANGNASSSGDRIVLWKDTFNIIDRGLTLLADITPISCPDSTNGAINLIVNGGVPPYNYLWNTKDTTQSIDRLDSGIFSVTVVDSDSLFIVDSFFIHPGMDTIPPEFICFADTLIIQSCAPFSYPEPIANDCCGSSEVILISGNGINQAFEIGDHLEIYQATDQFQNVALCTLFISNQAEITADIEVIDLACHDDSTGSVQIDVSGTNAPFTLLINDSLSLENLIPKSYNLSVTDNSGCRITDSFTIKIPDTLLIKILDISNPGTSNSGDGFIDVFVAGGTPPYTFLWRTEDEDFSTDEDLNLLFPGDYILCVTDAGGCQVMSDTIKLDAITNITSPEISNLIQAWPNPATQFINLNVDGNERPEILHIYNELGMPILEVRDNMSNIDMGDFPPGTYILLVTLEGGDRGLLKFIKI